MTQLTWCADIHLDHAEPAAIQGFLGTLRETFPKTVVICGDISTSQRIAADLVRIADAVECPIHFVLGNHDHFHGAVSGVRDTVLELGRADPRIQWLPPAGVVTLDPTTALIGVDGWADGRHGNPGTTPLRLNDDRLIAELAGQPDRLHRLAVKRALADADAERLATLIDRAAESAERIVIATHVPPFPEVLPRSGHLATPEWLPLLVCGATGAAIRSAAERHADRRFVILAGHTHVAADLEILPRVRIITRAARYGTPTVQLLEL